METSATFIGTATVLLRLGAFTLLTDPNFLHRGQRAYLGHGLWSRRLTEPALGPADLPRLDGIVLSHLHGDHFDRVARRHLPRDVPVLTTVPAARRLRKWHFDDAVGLRAWDDVVLHHAAETLRVTSVPARHGPTGPHLAMPTTMGSILDWEVDGVRRLRLYISGDTRFNRHVLRDIPSRFPGVDTMLLHLGGTRVLGLLVTMDARDGLQLANLIRPRRIIPIHYDDYGVFRDPLSNFLAADVTARTDAAVTPILRGETVDLAPAGRVAGSAPITAT
ncbi:MBL fold metallo-hydrolase [Dactylosporangium vinaceum]|uniref:MBL fold metallo-hydrolase n=1 Tax=Dactylosporangium vinaceum TaxID=53362 RepID=A0ABV5MN33_9ACTN|nr:MBL fold metallo-hydrolase [Dactylosporangium vinaceum]UAB92336.1 MBL fold metallo-hydrolase [Dactylosporangium vinaceum]